MSNQSYPGWFQETAAFVDLPSSQWPKAEEFNWELCCVEYITRVIAPIAVNTDNRELVELYTNFSKLDLSLESLSHFWDNTGPLNNINTQGTSYLSVWINSIIKHPSIVHETTHYLLQTNTFLDRTRLRAMLELAMVASGEYKYFSVWYDAEPISLPPEQPTIFERWTDEERVSCVLLLFVVGWGIVYCTALIYSTLNLFNYLSK